MGKNWAIVIGINTYDNLQSLNYAQRDAAAMRDYFLNEAGFEKVYYFAEDAPNIDLDYGPPFKPLPTFAKLDRFLDIRFEQDFLGQKVASLQRSATRSLQHSSSKGSRKIFVNQLKHPEKWPFMGKFSDKKGLKSPFCHQFCQRFDHHLRASFSFQAFFTEILARQVLQRSCGTSLQRRYLLAF